MYKNTGSHTITISSCTFYEESKQEKRMMAKDNIIRVGIFVNDCKFPVDNLNNSQLKTVTNNSKDEVKWYPCNARVEQKITDGEKLFLLI